MARIKRNNARTLVAGPAMPFGGCKYDETDGLLFTIQIGLVQVVMDAREKSILVAKWDECEKEAMEPRKD